MICCIVNIVLDILLVVVFKLGIVGVAIATSVAQACSAILVLNTLMKLDSIYRLSWNQVRFHETVLKEMIKIGLPAGVQSVMNSLSGCISLFFFTTSKYLLYLQMILVQLNKPYSL